MINNARLNKMCCLSVWVKSASRLTRNAQEDFIFSETPSRHYCGYDFRSIPFYRAAQLAESASHAVAYSCTDAMSP